MELNYPVAMAVDEHGNWFTVYVHNGKRYDKDLSDLAGRLVGEGSGVKLVDPKIKESNNART
jgi:hypothetical protein